MQTYEFVCNRCEDRNPVYLTFTGIMEGKRACSVCGSTVIPHLPYFRDMAGRWISDIRITPGMARDWLNNPFPTFESEIDYDVVTHYAGLMRNFQWQDATIVNGTGMLVPLLFISETLVLGYNRLNACLQSGHSFTNTVIKV